MAPTSQPLCMGFLKSWRRYLRRRGLWGTLGRGVKPSANPQVLTCGEFKCDLVIVAQDKEGSENSAMRRDKMLEQICSSGSHQLPNLFVGERLLQNHLVHLEPAGRFVL